MEKARHSFAQGGGGCTVKNEQRLPSDCVYIFTAAGPHRKALGKVGERVVGEMYTLLSLLGGKNNIGHGLY